jgi:hypothetical protein
MMTVEEYLAEGRIYDELGNAPSTAVQDLLDSLTTEELSSPSVAWLVAKRLSDEELAEEADEAAY